MKKAYKSILFFLGMIFFLASCNNNTDFSQLSYVLSDDGSYYTVYGEGEKDIKEITIPSTYKDKPVKEIGYCAFKNYYNLTNVTIPNTITSIKIDAFYNCQKLKNISVIDSDTEINLFDESNTINLPTELEYLGNGAFQNCAEIEKITIPNSVTIIEYRTFYGCKKLKTVQMSDNVTEIRDDAFYNCERLNDITISNNLVNIGEKAFYGCKNINSITIPYSTIEIGEKAFYECYKLIEIYNLSSINITKLSYSNGYVGCYAKKIHSSLSEPSILTIDDNGFMFAYDGENGYLIDYFGDNLEIKMPDNFKYNNNLITNYEIYQYALYYHDEIMNIVLSDSITGIGDYSLPEKIKCNEYENAYYLGSESNPYMVLFKVIDYRNRNCEINEDCEYVYSDAFKWCIYLETIIIPDNVKSIGESAFCDCYNLLRVTIGKNVTNIKGSAFSGCHKLVEVYNLSNINLKQGHEMLYFYSYVTVRTNINAKSILTFDENGYVFAKIKGNYYLVSYDGFDENEFWSDRDLILPDSFIYNDEKISNYNIFDRAFYGDYDVENIKISNSVMEIGNYAFNTNIDNVIISNTVNKIGDEAWRNYIEIFYEGTENEWNSIVIYEDFKEELNSRLLYYYSEDMPITSGNYWHYVNNEIVIW